jgi:hypothetical protein
MTDRIILKATINIWEPGRLGVDYRFEDGTREAHPITAADWRIIRGLERQGRVSYIGHKARKLAEKLRGRLV